MANIRPGKSVARNFSRVYPELVRRYLRRGRRLVEQQADNQLLHDYRIRTKRLRYVTELYAEVFPKVLDFALEDLRRIQEALGKLQDQTMVIDYFERRLMHVRTAERQTEYVRVLHRARVRQQRYRLAFFRLWERLDKKGFERRLLATVERAAPSAMGG